MEYESKPDGRMESMAHVIEGTFNVENAGCKVYTENKRRDRR